MAFTPKLDLCHGSGLAWRRCGRRPRRWDGLSAADLGEPYGPVRPKDLDQLLTGDFAAVLHYHSNSRDDDVLLKL